MPSGMDSGSANARTRNNRNASKHYTLGPSTYGVSAAGAAAFKLANVGVATYESSNMGGTMVYPGWEMDIVNIG